MARRVGLSPIGIGKLVVFAGAVLIYGAHQLAVKVGLVGAPETHKSYAAEPLSQSLAERDAEVKRMIAERNARAKSLAAENGR